MRGIKWYPRSAADVFELAARIALAAMALTAPACSWNPQPTPAEPRTTTRVDASLGDRIADIARQQLGTRYRYGGSSPEQGFDCSGLVYFAHFQLGISVPRVSRDQYHAAKPLTLAQAAPGDLLFFSDQAKLSHVGIYIGNGRFIHAPTTGRAVEIGSLDTPYYRRYFVGAGRLH